mmetsp:Transcript_142891/g.266376  ORF Transcript_142891/g.266376 Transcript_142891/m.266376 type:complete len:156 (-) Transcript_142891:413-880(-)
MGCANGKQFEGAMPLTHEEETTTFSTVSRFQFFVGEEEHCVEIGHKHCCWRIEINKVLVDCMVHENTPWKNAMHKLDFTIDTSAGPMNATARMKWHKVRVFWEYKLSVNGQDVPACLWRGQKPSDKIPEATSILTQKRAKSTKPTQRKDLKDYSV